MPPVVHNHPIDYHVTFPDDEHTHSVCCTLPIHTSYSACLPPILRVCEKKIVPPIHLFIRQAA